MANVRERSVGEGSLLEMVVMERLFFLSLAACTLGSESGFLWAWISGRRGLSDSILGYGRAALLKFVYVCMY
jgi:hypothetical protein